jgi:hypothetical protein
MPQLEKKEDKEKVERIPINDETATYALGSMLYKRFEYWRDRKRSIEEQWLKNIRANNSVYENSIKIDPNGSKQYIGITRMKTTAAYARLVDIYFPATSHRFWSIKPTPYPALSIDYFDEEELVSEEGESFPDEEVLDETTHRMQTRIEDQLVEADSDTLIRSAIKDQCTLGSGIIKAGMVRVETTDVWVKGVDRWERVKEERIVPGLENPSPFNVYFDINAASPEASIGTYERHVLNKEEVRDLRGMAGFDEDVIDELIRDYPEGNHNREHHEIARQALGNITTSDSSGYYEVLEYWGIVDGETLRTAGFDIPEDMLGEGFQTNIWISGHKTLKIMIDNSLNKGKKYYVFPYEQISNQLWGVGVPEIMMDSQDVLNAAFRRLLDDVAMTGNQLEINTERLSDKSVQTANEIKPWKIWYRTGGDEAYNAITVHKVPSMGAELIQIIEMVRRFIDDETNLPSLIHGQSQEGAQPGADTASGMSMLMGAAQVVIKSVVKNIDDYLVKPLIQSYYAFNMEWSDDESIKGDMKINALGSVSMTAREINNRNMIEFLSITANENDMPLVKRPQMLREIAKNMGFEPEDVIKSNKVLAAEAAEPDPDLERIKQLEIEKLELENAEVQGKINVLKSEEEKNQAEVKYKKEFLRQRRIQMAEDIKQNRLVNREKIALDREKTKENGDPGKTKATKIINKT